MKKEIKSRLIKSHLITSLNYLLIHLEQFKIEQIFQVLIHQQKKCFII